MTAMTDVAFLLLTFFMLTAKMKPTEPVVIDTPSSISDTKLPDTEILTISVDHDGKVYLNMDNVNVNGVGSRAKLIDDVNTYASLGLSPELKARFVNAGTFGQPIRGMKPWLEAPPGERSKMPAPGIPIDSTNNELATWVTYARLAGNNRYRIVIKADQTTKYPAIRKVINTLQDMDINKFNLITDLETNPNKKNQGLIGL